MVIFQPSPQVTILPLGTGNDLSRVMGWGEGYTGDVDIKSMLDLIDRAKIVKLDRWRVQITPAKFGIRMRTKVRVSTAANKLKFHIKSDCLYQYSKEVAI